MGEGAEEGVSTDQAVAALLNVVIVKIAPGLLVSSFVPPKNRQHEIASG